ncbi:MAG: class I SAM-dependent methyltransferase [Anaerolineales bacterium]
MNKWLYELFYSIPFISISWIFGSPHERKEYVQLVENGSLTVGTAIDLGCGEGSNAIYLSQKGFDVTGVDYSPTAIKRATTNAQAALVEVTFVEDDLTQLRHVNGTFDLLVDFGAINDLNSGDRDLYLKNVLPLTHPGCHFILMCFTNSLPPDEIEGRFVDHFNIENLTRRSERVTPRAIDFYFMTSK